MIPAYGTIGAVKACFAIRTTCWAGSSRNIGPIVIVAIVYLATVNAVDVVVEVRIVPTIDACSSIGAIPTVTLACGAKPSLNTTPLVEVASRASGQAIPLEEVRAVPTQGHRCVQV